MSDALRQAAEQALDALTTCDPFGYDGHRVSEAIDALRAALAAPQQAAPQQAEPEGWVAVPKKPTQAMQENGAQEFAMTAQRVQTAERSASDIYRAMLAAARTTGLE
jgi:hypothetical protein